MVEDILKKLSESRAQMNEEVEPPVEAEVNEEEELEEGLKNKIHTGLASHYQKKGLATTDATKKLKYAQKAVNHYKKSFEEADDEEIEEACASDARVKNYAKDAADDSRGAEAQWESKKKAKKVSQIVKERQAKNDRIKSAANKVSKNEEVDEGGGSRRTKAARQSAAQHATLNRELKKHGDSADMVGDDGTGTKSVDVQTTKGKYANADRRGKVWTYEEAEQWLLDNGYDVTEENINIVLEEWEKDFF